MTCLGIELKVATKTFSQKFACSSSVTGTDEVIIQGDVKDELFDLIPAKWPQVIASIFLVYFAFSLGIVISSSSVVE